MSILINNISFSYGTISVFKDLSFSIPKGEIWALLGKSGIGKTTLLQIIAGLFTPNEGQVQIKNKIASPGLIKGIVFQDESLLGWLRVRENLFFPLEKLNTAQNARANDLLESIELIDFSENYPFELSSGMKKRLEFGRALLCDQEFILADEPFGPVDAVTRRHLWELWLKLKKTEPRTGILCTHDPEEAIRLCDVVVTMLKGKENVNIKIIKIPKSVRQLGLNEESSALWDIKKEIIESLENNSDAKK
jgi:ABC-type nitrate/sulfonate/bicarbonate transport system ATPase subunit